MCTLYSEEIPTARYLTYGEIANISQYIFNFLVSRVSNSGNYINDEESNYTYSVGNISYIFIKPVKPIFLSIFFSFLGHSCLVIFPIDEVLSCEYIQCTIQVNIKCVCRIVLKLQIVQN